MRLRVLLGCVAAASACNPQQDGRWVVREGEHAAEAAYVLGIGVDKLTNVNEFENPDLVYAGNTYTVPYVASVKPPATWNIKPVITGTKSSCLAYLELCPSTTFMTQTKTASNSGAPPSSTSGDGSSSSDTKAPIGETTTGKVSIGGTHTGKDSASETATGKGIQESETAGSSSTSSVGKTSSQPAVTTGAPSATDCASPVSSTCASEVQPSLTTSGSSGPDPTSTPEPFCIVENLPERRMITDPGKQTDLAAQFCNQSREPLSRTNPGYLSYYLWKQDGDKDSGAYFYSLHWTGWDQSCPPVETIDVKRCISMLTQSYQRCDNGGIGGIIKVGCVVYEFRSFGTGIISPPRSSTSATATAGSSTTTQPTGGVGTTTPDSSIARDTTTSTTTPMKSA
ncbi:hypothetical protein PCL_07071 [Purpureocillium lilacinum]|uniref:LysM domain-containing protein n=1 Tax=Purpureocillium lilacinum TaxID=33203 RepID=A0A2U3DT92_PURLI|nr:hypothetical protein PCL_07071 [Purpureocillium lilacinum]